MLLRPSICARSAWAGDRRECRRLYQQFLTDFSGRFAAIRRHYGWKREPMLCALRLGKGETE